MRGRDERATFLSSLSAAGHGTGRRRPSVVSRSVRTSTDAARRTPPWRELLAENHVLVGPMTGDEYRRAIEQPALRVGVHVEPALTEALVEEVLGRARGASAPVDGPPRAVGSARRS